MLIAIKQFLLTYICQYIGHRMRIHASGIIRGRYTELYKCTRCGHIEKRYILRRMNNG